MTDAPPRRKPQVIPLDDPDLVIAPEGLSTPERSAAAAHEQAADTEARAAGAPAAPRLAANITARRRVPWGSMLLAALSLLGGLALALSFARFVAAAFERQDWIGWVAFALLALAAVSFLAILGREVTGILRLRRLGRARRHLEAALARRDPRAEREALEEIFSGLRARPELRWSLAELAEHAPSASDPGDLARLADRHVMPELDRDARRIVASSARRVSVVTALSPMAFVTVGWILAENLRMLRALGTLYGGRPGFLATARLARMVATHIVATGGIALTDDLLGQFLGQDLIRRLSRRLGESVFNAALTARVGAAAIEVIRPLPYLEAPRVRARDLVADIVRSVRGGNGGGDRSAGRSPAGTRE